MKRGLFIVMLLTIAVSAKAMVCTSKEDASKKLILTDVKGSNFSKGLVAGNLLTDQLDHIFAGTKTSSFDKITYDLFDQQGIQFEFIISNKVISTGGHCRARVCPPHGDIDLDPTKIGKLKLTEEEYEYFTCI